MKLCLLISLVLLLFTDQINCNPLIHRNGPIVRQASNFTDSELETNRIQPRNVTIADPEAQQFVDWNIEEVLETGNAACNAENAPGRHQVYCSGRLLHAVMALHLYKDSKTFVDKPIKANYTGDEIMAEFDKRFPQKVELIDRNELALFVEDHFDPEGHELNQCRFNDWEPKPHHITEVRDRTLRSFGLKLHEIWNKLCRQVNPIVRLEPERFSQLYVPNAFVIPGGRFLENYYWDAYWIIKGLLVSGMNTTVKGMIRNFGLYLEKYGLIPNGGRVYYLARSQPPLFSAMIYEYYEKTSDLDFIREMLPLMEKEIQFWKKNRAIQVEIRYKNHTVYQYRSPVNGPRPESYREDVISSLSFDTIPKKQQFFQNIASAAESGWDFSSRWFADKQHLTTIMTTRILPIDLNAFICYNLNIISHFHDKLGNTNKFLEWKQEHVEFMRTFREVFYVPHELGWFDYNLDTHEHNLEFYPSIAIPLFTQCYDTLSTQMAENVYNRMEKSGVFKFAGGIPTSLRNDTGQQWDFPNGWSALNHMIIEGLRKSTNPRMQQKAYELAEKWVLSNLKVFQRDGVMWEKYNVVANKPRTGGGGEYEVQAGFGWTNGAVLDLLHTYRERIRYPDIHPPIIPVPRILRTDQEADPDKSNFHSSLTTLVTSTTIIMLIILHL